jgi:arylsulfatase A-like enzyme
VVSIRQYTEGSPGSFPSGMTITDQVQLVDIFPTLMDVLDVQDEQVRNQVQGYSLLPDRVADRPRQFAVAELARRSWKQDFRRYPGFDYAQFERDLKTIRTDRFKLIWASDGRHELYDVVADPDESINLLEVCLEEAECLQDRLFDFIDSIEYTGETTEEDIEMDRVLEQHLRDLGYID